MAYKGHTISIPCNVGGFAANPNTDVLPPIAMITGTKNLNLHNGGRQKRGGTAVINTVTGNPNIEGLIEFQIPGGTQYIVRNTADGKIYRDNTNTILTGLTASKPVSFEIFAKELYSFNGTDCPYKWTGSGNMAILTDIPADWTGTNFPKQIVRHGKGNSERMWAIGCPTTPYTVYASPSGDGDDFSDANVTTLNIDTGDAHGLQAAVVMVDELMVFGKTKAYVIDDNDTDVSNWGYDQAAWTGGVAHHRVLIKTPNDVVAMMENGEIYSVRAAQEYGDYQRASLTRPSMLHKWIKDNIDLSKVGQFHGIYDPNLRAIKLWVVRSGETECDTCLVYFVEHGPESGWMIHDNIRDANGSGYQAACSALVRVGMGNWLVYTGDYNGVVWSLEHATISDGANEIDGGFKTPPLTMHFDGQGGSRQKLFKRLRLYIEPVGTEVILIDWWVDGTAQTQASITAASGTTEYIVELGAKGQKVQFEIFNQTAAKDFYIGQFKVDFKYLGKKPS